MEKIEVLYTAFTESTGVSIDTRNIKEGNLFFALKGPQFNANEFAKIALENGASKAVVDDEKYFEDDGRFILVENSLEALQQMANHHRHQFDIPFIGITGSNGKTTSKELIHAVLEKKFKTVATSGNYNNHIGVPLTLLRVDVTTEIAVIEMGANRPGDIAELTAIAEPTHGLITNIGKAHVGTFGGFDNVIRTKSELYHHLIQTDGVVWINSQDYILSNMAKRFKKPLFYPGEGDFYHCEFISANPFIKLKNEGGSLIETSLLGKYNFENIAVALCIGKYFEIDPQLAAEAVSAYVPSNNRSQIIKKGSTTIVLDAYNANPSSMNSAIDNINGMDGDRKILILGDMNELGNDSDEEHKDLGLKVKEMGFNEVFFCGKLISPAAEAFLQAKYYETKEAMASELAKYDFKDALVLIKASRSLGLETIVDVIN
ncbi:MAG: UDP-N-acetylmuramoyl-tripeptide--D-alanyl-D-alanine ligase [Bacteroidota bacterium]